MANNITIPFVLTPGPAGPGTLSSTTDALPAGNPTQIVAGTYNGADCRTGPVIYNAPAAPTDGAIFAVADVYGQASANPIIVNAVGVGVTIANPSWNGVGTPYGAAASITSPGATVQMWRYNAATQQWRFAS